MYEDHIVEETRKAGIELFARFNNDIHTVCKYLRQRAGERGSMSVSLPPRQPDGDMSEKKAR
jgi:hypothetical protein